MSAHHDARIGKHPTNRLLVLGVLGRGSCEFTPIAHATGLGEGPTAQALSQLEARGRVRRRGSFWELVRGAA